jgi:type IV secretion system protein VirD4
VHSTAKTCLSLYADPVVAVNTSTSDFEIRDLVDFDIPISLYLVVPPSDEIRLRPLIRLIFTMVVNRLTEKIEYDGAQLVPNRQRLLFLIDEFPSLRHMEIFAGALSFMRGYGLKAYLIAQDIRQIIDSYGPNESIVSNCHIRVAFAPNQIETAEMLSKMLGQRTIEKASYSFSGRRRAWSLHNMTASVEQVERPLLTADEVGRLPSEAALVFTTGQRPFYCRKIRYFDDPEFASRASISPPRELVRIVPNLHQATAAEPEPEPAAEPVPSEWPL